MEINNQRLNSLLKYNYGHIVKLVSVQCNSVLFIKLCGLQLNCQWLILKHSSDFGIMAGNNQNEQDSTKILPWFVHHPSE